MPHISYDIKRYSINPSPSLSSLSINFQVMRLSKLLCLVLLVYALLRSSRHENCETQFNFIKKKKKKKKKTKKNFNASYLFLRKTRAKLYSFRSMIFQDSWTESWHVVRRWSGRCCFWNDGRRLYLFQRPQVERCWKLNYLRCQRDSEQPGFFVAFFSHISNLYSLFSATCF